MASLESLLHGSVSSMPNYTTSLENLCSISPLQNIITAAKNKKNSKNTTTQHHPALTNTTQEGLGCCPLVGCLPVRHCSLLFVVLCHFGIFRGSSLFVDVRRCSSFWDFPWFVVVRRCSSLFVDEPVSNPGVGVCTIKSRTE